MKTITAMTAVSMAVTACFAPVVRSAFILYHDNYYSRYSRFYGRYSLFCLYYLSVNPRTAMTTITTFYAFRVLYPCSISVFRNPLPAFCVLPQPFLCLSADDAALLCALNNAAASFFLLIRSDTQGLD